MKMNKFHQKFFYWSKVSTQNYIDCEEQVFFNEMR